MLQFLEFSSVYKKTTNARCISWKLWSMQICHKWYHVLHAELFVDTWYIDQLLHVYLLLFRQKMTAVALLFCSIVNKNDNKSSNIATFKITSFKKKGQINYIVIVYLF